MPKVLVGTSNGASLLDDRGRETARLLEGRVPGPFAAVGDDVLTIVDGCEIWRVGSAEERLAWWSGADLTCVAPLGDGAIVGTVGAHVAKLVDGAIDVDESFDALPEREKWYTPWGAPADTRSLATRGDRCYVNIHVGGVASREAGSWRALVDIDVDVHQVIAFGDDGLAVATGAAAIGVSRDDGRSWTWRDAGLHGTYARAIAVAGDTMIVTSSTGPFSKEGAVYRAPLSDDDAPFERCREGIPAAFTHNLDTHTLAAGADLVALVTPEGDVFTSGDDGSSWEQIAEGLDHPRAVAILE